ncbi:M42 family metallopeptidase [Candidatus Bathyarchaeota archaeon]|nr:M42 family metallopeptidase [Candidatus Bathyarchaeota archaeon]
MPREIKLLEELSNAFGPSGDEQDVTKLLMEELEPYADDTRVDKLGNAFFCHKGRDGYPKVMVSAHMDEVGFITTFVEEDGFLRFDTLGGIANNIMPGQRILLRGEKGYLKGIIGTKPPHIMTADELNKIIPKEDLFIDIGADSISQAQEKGADVGTMGVFDVEFADLGNGYFRGKAFDDRAGCTVLAEAFKLLKNSPYNVIAVGSVQEELGIRGARTAAWQVDPDYGLAVEGTFVSDVPNTRPDRVSSKIKGGPVITILDKTVFTHPTILKTLIRVCRERSIPFQFKKVPVGGTDAGAIHLTKAGVPSGTVAVPCRYIHGPASILHIDDLRNATQLVAEFVKTISVK